jgi:alkanesulfonate monooxygenase SsuD/methylene tetrahydromethanopterin reductase-like flavin-dependent oxidoreductase (luciferase family)
MSLEFGIFDHLDRSDLPLPEYYEARLKLIEDFDRTGFYSYHLAEHHFTPLGMAPSPNIFLSAVAQRTKNLRFGPLVLALPLHHPLRVAEEICMLDHLSGGRLDIGFGRGASPIEVDLYGVDSGVTQRIYEERLEIILKALTNTSLSFAGAHDKFADVPMELVPLQKPHPPLWYGVHSPESAERAARAGLNIINNDVPELTNACLSRYRAVWHEMSGDKGPAPKLGVVRFIVVAESETAALRAAARSYQKWHQSFHALFRLHGRTPARGKRAADFATVMRTGLGIAGTPATVRDYLAEQLAGSDANYLVGQFAFGDLTLDEMRRSVALFAREVMPALRARTKATERIL